MLRLTLTAEELKDLIDLVEANRSELEQPIIVASFFDYAVSFEGYFLNQTWHTGLQLVKFLLKHLLQASNRTNLAFKLYDLVESETNSGKT